MAQELNLRDLRLSFDADALTTSPLSRIVLPSSINLHPKAKNASDSIARQANISSIASQIADEMAVANANRGYQRKG